MDGGGGNDTINGGFGNDFIQGNAQDDVIFGGLGDDTIRGGKDDGSILGNQGGDVLYGDKGDDILYGGKNGDTLYGGEDNDTLHGDLGNDSLDGGVGVDEMTGGGGNDIFVIRPDANSTDVIHDFDQDVTNGLQEKIDIRRVSSLQDFESFKTAHLSQNGNGTVISLPNQQTITLSNVTLSALDATDFIGAWSDTKTIHIFKPGNLFEHVPGNEGANSQWLIDDVHEYVINGFVGGNAGNTDLYKPFNIIDLTEFGFASNTDILSYASEVGNDVVLTFTPTVDGETYNQTVTITNTTLSDFTADNFLLEPSADANYPYNEIFDDLRADWWETDLQGESDRNEITDTLVQQSSDSTQLTYQTNATTVTFTNQSYQNSAQTVTRHVVENVDAGSTSIIEGFTPSNGDVINLGDIEITNFNDLGIVQLGNDTVINTGEGRSVVLKDVDANQLNTQHFELITFDAPKLLGSYQAMRLTITAKPAAILDANGIEPEKALIFLDQLPEGTKIITYDDIPNTNYNPSEDNVFVLRTMTDVEGNQYISGHQAGASLATVSASGTRVAIKGLDIKQTETAIQKAMNMNELFNTSQDYDIKVNNSYITSQQILQDLYPDSDTDYITPVGIEITTPDNAVENEGLQPFTATDIAKNAYATLEPLAKKTADYVKNADGVFQSVTVGGAHVGDAKVVTGGAQVKVTLDSGKVVVGIGVVVDQIYMSADGNVRVEKGMSFELEKTLPSADVSDFLNKAADILKVIGVGFDALTSGVQHYIKSEDLFESIIVAGTHVVGGGTLGTVVSTMIKGLVFGITGPVSLPLAVVIGGTGALITTGLTNYKFDNGTSISDNFTDLGVLSTDAIRELINNESTGQETAINVLNEGYREALSPDDQSRAHFDSSGNNGISSGSLDAEFLAYLGTDGAEDLINGILAVEEQQSLDQNQSSPTPDSLLYFIESLPEGGIGSYAGRVYEKQGDSLISHGTLTEYYHELGTDNDASVDGLYYYHHHHNPQDDNPDNAYNAGLTVDTGDYFSVNGTIYRKGLGDDYEVAQFTDNDGDYVAPTDIAYFTDDPDGNVIVAPEAAQEGIPIDERIITYLQNGEIQNALGDFTTRFKEQVLRDFGFDEEGNFVLFDGDESQWGAGGLGSTYGGIISDIILGDNVGEALTNVGESLVRSQIQAGIADSFGAVFGSTNSVFNTDVLKYRPSRIATSVCCAHRFASVNRSKLAACTG